MRPLRPLARLDARRAAYRRRYAEYMASPAWWRRRERWCRDEIAATGRAPQCAVCGREWALTSGDLHHATYDNLGREHHGDLIPMCRTCHERLHQILDDSRHWRKLPRALATTQLVTILRRQHQRAADTDQNGDRHP
jgi:5-methylcytosine-specific restriction endonuclease McrA